MSYAIYSRYLTNPSPSSGICLHHWLSTRVLEPTRELWPNLKMGHTRCIVDLFLKKKDIIFKEEMGEVGKRREDRHGITKRLQTNKQHNPVHANSEVSPTLINGA